MWTNKFEIRPIQTLLKNKEKSFANRASNIGPTSDQVGLRVEIHRFTLAAMAVRV